MPLQPTIYYICRLPPSTGGELVNLQHVATLNRSDLRAVALVNDEPNLASELTMPFELSVEK